jgi:hypothetical protein
LPRPEYFGTENGIEPVADEISLAAMKQMDALLHREVQILALAETIPAASCGWPIKSIFSFSPSGFNDFLRLAN